MLSNSDRVLAYLALHPEGQDDDQIGAALQIDRIQINQICRRLAENGAIYRSKPANGVKIHNWPIASGEMSTPDAATISTSEPAAEPLGVTTVIGPVIWLDDIHAVERFAYKATANLGEDQVKMAIKQTLEKQGWQTEVRWGHIRGIDIEAIRNDERFVLEAKGEGISDQVRGNYFNGALGELISRMNAPNARYGLALPAHRGFSGLVVRTPLWIRQRLNLWFFFVRPIEGGLQVGVFPPDAKRNSL